MSFTYAIDNKTGSADTLTALQKHDADSLDRLLLLPFCKKSAVSNPSHEIRQCIFRDHTIKLVEWLVAKHTDAKSIADEVQKRYDCLFTNDKMAIDTTVFPIAGAKTAPLLIVAYVSATCPLCHYISRELFIAVSQGGALFGKARFMAKPFGVTPGNLSLCAANTMGKFWDYFLALSYVKERVDPDLFFHIADSLGMKKTHLKEVMDSRKTIDMAQKSTDEAQKNTVTVTPCIFINAVRYRSYKDPRWIIDAAEIKYETSAKSLGASR